MPICPSCRTGFEENLPSCPSCGAPPPPRPAEPADIDKMIHAALPRCSGCGILCMRVAQYSCLLAAVLTGWDILSLSFGGEFGSLLSFLATAGLGLLSILILCGCFVALGLAVRFARRE